MRRVEKRVEGGREAKDISPHTIASSIAQPTCTC